MKAITHRRYGPPAVLTPEERRRPEPGPGVAGMVEGGHARGKVVFTV